MKSKLLFRKAKDMDISELKQISEEVIRKNYPLFLGADNVKNYIESGEAAKEIETNIENIIIADYEGKIVGLSILKENLLHLIMIKYDLQGQGLGGIFLEYIEKELFKNYPIIKLESFEGNTLTIEFYKKHHWQIIEKEFSEFINAHIIKFEKSKKIE
ncbi:MAG: GNAT family N-acetyltransferase [Lactovum sp.]